MQQSTQLIICHGMLETLIAMHKGVSGSKHPMKAADENEFRLSCPLGCCERFFYL